MVGYSSVVSISIFFSDRLARDEKIGLTITLRFTMEIMYLSYAEVLTFLLVDKKIFKNVITL